MTKKEIKLITDKIKYLEKLVDEANAERDHRGADNARTAADTLNEILSELGHPDEVRKIYKEIK